MKPISKIIIAGALLLTLSVAANLRLAHQNRHSAENISALREENCLLRSLAAKSADSLATRQISAPRQILSRRELRKFYPDEHRAVRSMGVRSGRVESLGRVVSITGLDLLLEPEESPVATIHDTLRPLVWHDGWVGVKITPRPEGVRVNVTSTDTLRQIVHRVPHRWWIFSWGTKAIRQEIASSNPHTRLVYAEYIEIER